jgi:hypothetical protein
LPRGHLRDQRLHPGFIGLFSMVSQNPRAQFYDDPGHVFQQRMPHRSMFVTDYANEVQAGIDQEFGRKRLSSLLDGLTSRRRSTDL